MTTTEYASHTSPIDPRDYTQWQSSAHKGWSPGLLALIVEMLEGTPVGIVTDNGTGHMPLGVRLVGMGSSPGYGSPTVIVEHPHGPDCTKPLPLPDGRIRQACPPNCKGFHRTAYLWFKIGMIIPLAESKQWFKSDLSKRLYDMSAKTLPLAKAALDPDDTWYCGWTHEVVSPTEMQWKANRYGHAIPVDKADPPRTGAWVTVAMPVEVTA